MEYCASGDLASIIKSSRENRSPLHEDWIWKVFTQIVMALHACHIRPEGKILHRDLKPGNVFLDGQHCVKLGDFGLARMMNKDSFYAKTHVGTPYYMSPEQIQESWYNEKSDIWSAGCMLYELCALIPPLKKKINKIILNFKIILPS